MNATINTANLSDVQKKAVQRIRVLQVLYERTGFSTQREQFETLIALNDADCLAVCAAVGHLKKGGNHGNSDPR